MFGMMLIVQRLKLIIGMLGKQIRLSRGDLIKAINNSLYS
jgi:hypothetical protein